MISCRYIWLIGFVVSVGCIQRHQQEDVGKLTPERLTGDVFTDTTIQIDTTTMVQIEEGNFKPLFGSTDSTILIPSFDMDQHAVTNSQYIEFLKRKPDWRKSKVRRIYIDENYLNDWKNDTIPPDYQTLNSPVTNISWFAAKTYCECIGKDLPTVNQWEYVAAAGKLKPDERKDESYNKNILKWYQSPKEIGAGIYSTQSNFYNIWDMHGLIWEWTYDFNEVMLSGESRRDVSTDNDLFCGSGSIGATDLMNYAAFMRYAFRGSVKANYSIKNLGFRCVKNKK